MKARLLFEIDLDYELTAYNTLNSIGRHKYNPNKKKYEWLFDIKDLDGVIAAIAKPIEFDENEVKKVVALCPPILSKIPSTRWKGDGEYTYVETPDIFECGEWQKGSNGVPKQMWTKIPKQNVIDIWNILLRYEIGKYIKGSTIAEHLCREKGYDRFFRDSGTFDFMKFWGGHRKTYMPLCYWPFKILHYLGNADYTKMGKIARIKDKLEFQVKLQ